MAISEHNPGFAYEFNLCRNFEIIYFRHLDLRCLYPSSYANEVLLQSIASGTRDMNSQSDEGLQRLSNAARSLADSAHIEDPMPIVCLSSEKLDRILEAPTSLSNLLGVVTEARVDGNGSVSTSLFEWPRISD